MWRGKPFIETSRINKIIPDLGWWWKDPPELLLTSTIVINMCLHHHSYLTPQYCPLTIIPMSFTKIFAHFYTWSLGENITFQFYVFLLLTCCSREFFSPPVSHNWVHGGEEWVEHWLWYISTTILTTLLQHHQHHHKSAAHWTSKLCYINKIGKMQMPSKQISLYLNWICLQKRKACKVMFICLFLFIFFVVLFLYLWFFLPSINYLQLGLESIDQNTSLLFIQLSIIENISLIFSLL